MNPLEAVIFAEIRARGPLSFARFMELALYHPEEGYYAQADAPARVGRQGDFFTSASVGPLFGGLLAKKFVRWWEETGKPQPFHLVEWGGLNGQLARDILTALRRDAPACAGAARYVLVEPLPRLAAEQKKALVEFSNVEWVSSTSQRSKLDGILFGNELLDSFPVHRLERVPSPSSSVGQRASNPGTWMECCVTLEKDRLAWTHQSCPEAWAAALPKHARGMTEHNPGALRWLEEAARLLRRGRILLLDYGWTDEEYFQVERTAGTLRGYHAHRATGDLLARPGEQDLTAHVRWTPLLEGAARLGLRIGDFIQQGRWLSRIVAENRMKLDAAEVRQFNTLAHPEIMGAPFRVLELAR